MPINFFPLLFKKSNPKQISMKNASAFFVLVYLLIARLAICGENDKIELVVSSPLGSELEDARYHNPLDAWAKMFDIAQKTIDICAFYMLHYPDPRSKGQIVEQLYARIESAANRGVKVRILLDYPVYASAEDKTAYQETPKRLSHLKNVEVHFVTIGADSEDPENEDESGMMHAKYFVVDSLYSYVGSQNWGYSALADNRELGLKIESRIVAEGLLTIFQTDWENSFAIDEPQKYINTSENLTRPKTIYFESLPASVDTTMRPEINWIYSVESSPAQLDNPAFPNTEETILRLIESADSLIEIEVNTYNDPKLGEALKRAAGRGVMVRFIIDGYFYHKAKWLFRALNRNKNIEVRPADIREAGPNPDRGTVHSKVLIVDVKRVFIGSATYSTSQLYNNRNVGVALESETIAKSCHSIFMRDWTSRYVHKVK